MDLTNRRTPQETLTAMLADEHASPGHRDPDVLCHECRTASVDQDTDD